MQIQLLGSMKVVADDGSSVDCGGVKQRAVLAQVALEPNHTVSVDRLAEGVWGESVPQRYRQNLQVYVSTLRRVLEPARTAGWPSRLVGHGEGYELVAATGDVDVSAFRAALADGSRALAHGRPQAAAEALRDGLALWAGDPLADLVALPFAADHLERLHREHLLARQLLAEAGLALGRHQDVLPEVADLVTRHPEHEHLWELYATALVRAGRQGESLEVLRRARAHLGDELGLDPGPALAELQARILRQDPTLQGPKPPTVRMAMVPLPLGPSIGREPVVASAVEALVTRRLVVLTGVGGVGKTRTAQEVAAASGMTSRWVPFESEAATCSVEDVIVRALGVSDEDLGDALDREPGLLVLDNLEHVRAARSSVGALLAAHPATRVLATSRGPLRVPGEYVLQVPLLDPATTALELFQERAAAVVPGFIAGRDRAVVVELCRRLDGLPLAIELAAARVAALTPAELLDHLPSMRELPDRDASGRQGSLTALVNWSLDLLPDHARAAARALAVLDGPVPGPVAVEVIRAAEATGAGGMTALRDDDPEPRQDLETLVHNALVQPVETTSGRRYAMLATIRDVCVGDGEADHLPRAVLSAVADMWLKTATVTDNAGPEEVAATADDIPVLRQVVGALVDIDEPTRATMLLSGRRRALAALGRQDILFDLTSRLLRCSRSGPWQAQARVLAGSAAYVKGSSEAASELLEAVVHLAHDDHVHRVLGHCFRAVLAADFDDHSTAQTEAEAAVRVADTSGQPTLLVRAHSAAAWVARLRGDHDRAVLHGHEGLSLAEGDAEVSACLVDIARGELMRDQPVRALELAREAVQRGRRMAGYILANAQQELGFSLLRTGQPDDAREVLVQALRDGPITDVGWQLETIAAVALTLIVGGIPEARQLLDDSSRAAQREGLGESAVPAELLTLANDHGVSTPELGGPGPSLAELRDATLSVG